MDGIAALAPEQYSNLGKTFKTESFNPNWTGSGEDSISAMIAQMISQNPQALQSLGLTPDDLKLISPEGYQGDSWNPAQWQVSDAARKALAGTTWNRTGLAGQKDGRSGVIRDASGNILNATKGYSYDPAGDLKDAALRAAAVMAAAYGGGQLLGAEGAGTGAAGAASTGAGTTGVTGAQGAFLGEGVTSGIGAWDAALANAAAGAGAAGGIGAIDSAFADLAASSGSLAPEGIGAIIPTGTELGAIGGGGILAGGALGGGVGAEASWLDKLLGKAGDKLTGAAKDAVKKILPGGGGGSGDAGDWAKYILPALAGYASYKDAKQPTLQGYTGGIQPRTATQSVQQSKYGPVVKTKFAAGGGIPRYIESHQDGMADGIGALIDGQQQAALSGGEFVVPADVVSHIGNGNSNAGAKQLYQMMDRIRAARTGTTQQGREINPTNFLPK